MKLLRAFSALFVIIFFIMVQLLCCHPAFAVGIADKNTSCDQVAKACDKKACEDCCCDGPRSQMLFNPAFGDDIYHTHPEGKWMFNFKYMHMEMEGLRHGTADVPVSDVIPMRGTKYGYMMAGTDMTMDMYMFMLMCGITDRLTGMVMVPYLQNKMNMLMSMGRGKGDRPEPPMYTRGIGDTELRGIYRINEYLAGSLGLSVPTGAIDKEFVTMRMTFRDPYNMQLGSGTWDLKPALTFNCFSDDENWNWGIQAQGVCHSGKNKNKYRLGDSINVTTWLQRAIGPLTPWLRIAYNGTGQIKGQDPEIQKLLAPTRSAPMADADTANYGGQRIDGLVGLSFKWKGISFGVEAGMPLYQYLNGLQMKRKWNLTAGAQVMF